MEVRHLNWSNFVLPESIKKYMYLNCSRKGQLQSNWCEFQELGRRKCSMFEKSRDLDSVFTGVRSPHLTPKSSTFSIRGEGGNIIQWWVLNRADTPAPLEDGGTAPKPPAVVLDLRADWGVSTQGSSPGGECPLGWHVPGTLFAPGSGPAVPKSVLLHTGTKGQCYPFFTSLVPQVHPKLCVGKKGHKANGWKSWKKSP